jgi:uncharacterized protein YvpB
LRSFSLVEQDVATFDQLRAEISAGRPVIILVNNKLFRNLTPAPYQNNNDGWFRPDHIVVVTGYDAANVYVNDPLRNSPNYPVPTATFAEAASTARGTNTSNWYAASIAKG